MAGIEEVRNSNGKRVCDISADTLPSDGDSCTFVMKQDVTVTAVNAAGYELPASGGIGTALYTFGGVLLIAAAGFLLYKKASKRRNDPSA